MPVLTKPDYFRLSPAQMGGILTLLAINTEQKGDYNISVVRGDEYNMVVHVGPPHLTERFLVESKSSRGSAFDALTAYAAGADFTPWGALEALEIHFGILPQEIRDLVFSVQTLADTAFLVVRDGKITEAHRHIGQHNP